MEKKYGNKYEVACAILEKLEQGGSGGGGGALVDGTKFKLSTFSTVPEYYDFSEITDFYEMFYNCQQLITVGNLDTSNGTDFNNMFRACYNLTTIQQINTSNGTNFMHMFNNCRNLTSVPHLDTSKCPNFTYMFFGCNKLKSVQQIDTTKATDFYNMFGSCTALENVSFVGSISSNIDFSYSTLLTYESIKSILTACDATTNTYAKTLSFNRTIADNNGELAALIADCTTKGWTITGLTLE